MKQRLFKGKSIMIFMAIVMMFTMLVGCGATENNAATGGNEFNVSVTDSTGETITLTSKPERIVSMAPSTTEILAALGVEDKIVGRTDFCNYPESITSVASVGGTSNPNVETIISLEPDLVVGSTHVSEEVINKLREVGINVVFLNEQEGFDGTYLAITSIGQLVGEDNKAAEVVASMKDKVADVKAKVEALSKTEKPKVYYMVGYGESDYTAGGDTFISEIINLAGGENIAQNIEGWGISKEEIAESAPDMIIAPSGMLKAGELQKTDFYKDLEAVKSGNVYEINGDMISRQGPRVADALVEMAEVINPELGSSN